MGLIAWDPNLNLQIDILDSQHRMIALTINELYDARMEGKHKDELVELIDKLRMYITVHFATEEHYFEKSGYPKARRHELEHSIFENNVTAFNNDLRKDRPTLPREIIRFLGDWMVAHITRSDTDFASFLLKKGVP